MQASQMEQRVRANINLRKAKRTPWFRKTDPAHKGWYEVENFPGSKQTILRYWDGIYWMTADSSEGMQGWMAVSMHQDWPWRGLVEKP